MSQAGPGEVFTLHNEIQPDNRGMGEENTFLPRDPAKLDCFQPFTGDTEQYYNSKILHLHYSVQFTIAVTVERNEFSWASLGGWNLELSRR